MLRTISNKFTTHTRYLFQAQEMDYEIKGEGNSVNYKYRMHDPRLGRFFSVDPLASKYPHNSPYAFSENNVIHAVELEGLEKAEPPYLVGSNKPNPNAGKAISEPNLILPGGPGLMPTKNALLLPAKKKESSSNIQNSNNTITPSTSNSGARDANNLLGKTALGAESGLNLKNVDAPNAKSFLKGAGMATTVVEGALIFENAVETGDYKQAGIDAGVLTFETVVIDRMITTPNPYTIATGVVYYLLKSMVVPCSNCGSAPLPENWDQIKDKDNTRTGGTGGGF